MSHSPDAATGQPRHILEPTSRPLRRRRSRAGGLSQNDLVSLSDEDLPPHIASRMLELKMHGMSENTRRVYAADWQKFERWCLSKGLSALPAAPSTLAYFLIESADLVDESGAWRYATATLSICVAAINKVHAIAGSTAPGEHPDVHAVLAGLRRERARPTKRMAPLTLDLLRDALGAIDLHDCPSGIIGHRDFVVLLFGFAGAFRRSELADLSIESMGVAEGHALHIFMARSKTDQEGRGSKKGLPVGTDPFTCPPCAYFRWIKVLSAVTNHPSQLSAVLAASNTTTHICQDLPPAVADLSDAQPLCPAMRKGGKVLGFVMGGGSVANVVKKRVAAIGLDPSKYGGHSLRSGFVTQAFRAGATHHEVMRQTGHKNPSTLEIYSREHNPLLHNAITQMGL